MLYNQLDRGLLFFLSIFQNYFRELVRGCKMPVKLYLPSSDGNEMNLGHQGIPWNCPWHNISWNEGHPDQSQSVRRKNSFLTNITKHFSSFPYLLSWSKLWSKWKIIGVFDVRIISTRSKNSPWYFKLKLFIYLSVIEKELLNTNIVILPQELHNQLCFTRMLITSEDVIDLLIVTLFPW